jgi:colanic acid/amylovoran biosynthesis glycosyltransferase
LRLAYLVSQYPFIRHTYLLREIRQLREVGWDISVIAIRPDDRAPTELTSEEREEAASTHYLLGNGIARLIFLQLRTFFTHPAGYFRGLSCALSYGRFDPVRTLYGLAYFAEAVAAGVWLEANNFFHVHTHYASTVAWILSRIFPIRISMTIHGSAEFDDTAGFRLRDKVIASESVIVISYFGRSQIMRAVPYVQWSKIEICPLGIDPESFPLADFRRDPEPFELLSVGGMASPRAVHILIQSAAILVRKGRRIVLRLVGDGPDRQLLQRLASELNLRDIVIFEGWKNQDELRAIYARTDIFVFSSFAEGIPVVLMEAMAHGLPCVAPRITGIPELIEHGVDGLLFTVSDEQELAAAIERLMDDPDSRLKIRQCARQKIENKYNSNRNVRALSDIFKRRLANASANGEQEAIRSAAVL